MKRNKTLSMILGITLILFSLINPAFASAAISTISTQQSIINESKELMKQALSEKTFYKYNVAYDKILQIQNDSMKNSLLSSLNTVTDTVWTDEIRSINKTLEALVSTKGSGKIYDEVQVQINNSKLSSTDKGYFLAEVASWGKKLVFTQDYGNAVDKLVKTWTKLSNNNLDLIPIDTYISNAQKAIDAVNNPYSRDYLNEQIRQIKSKVNVSNPLTICIDAGHGGSDLGIAGSSAGVYEKDITLSVAMKLGKTLENKGLRVVYTRNNDNVNWDKGDLMPRFKISNDSKADYFISIHTNTATGIETYYLKGNTEAQHLANSLNSEISKITGLTDRNKNSSAAKEAGVIPELEGTNATAVKIYLGFLSNPDEEKLLLSEGFHNKYVQAIENVLLKYKKTAGTTSNTSSGANNNITTNTNETGGTSSKILALAEDKTSTYFANYDYILSKVNVGDNYTFPSAVRVLLSDGSKKVVPITWSGTPNTSKVGTYLFKGTIAGYNSPINLSLMVLNNKNYKHMVFIDAGHGGYDPGAIGPNNSYEKSITIAVAKKLGKILQDQGIGVAYTRTDDNYPKSTGQYHISKDLQKRCDMAALVNAEYFLSIHTNSISSNSITGIETYYLEGSAQGQKLAMKIQQQLVKSVNSVDRGVKTANYYVLKNTASTAILTELGFISNLKEEELLNSDAYQNKLANAIANAIISSFN